ncbi:hypothetical protein DFP72DRAFT_1068516 [Ephemerocybe angulata]|uniref:Uncharacterized protein n=1 Tax=Ephemerocybe angulata TaxID=980116 RepID=A0A8H6M7V8_9AGAR|nr:hypothetical protein DFP72DRAFT_1068516 [Tulosesus angulatus]
MLRRARLTTRLYRQYSSSANADPYANFRKLRAFPFAFGESTAKAYMGLYASAICDKDLLGSAVARFLGPFLGENWGIQPTRIVPLYFPAWIADAELKADVSYKDSPKTVDIQLQNVYLPGSDYQVLSSVPLVDIEGELIPSQREPKPWSTAMMRQYDQDISCLPFTLHPIAGLRALKDMETEVYPELKCRLDTVRESFVVHRPVLIPVYLAQYDVEETEGEKRSCTVFIDASSKSGGTYAFRSPDSLYNEYDTGVDDLAKTMDFLSPDNPHMFSFTAKRQKFVGQGTVSLSPPRDIYKALTNWVSMTIRNPEVIEEVAKCSQDQLGEMDSDPRIRVYDTLDRSETSVWMELGAEKMMVRRIIERIDEQVKEMDEDVPEHMEIPIKHLQGQEQALEEKRAELEPSWWKDYVDHKKQDTRSPQ